MSGEVDTRTRRRRVRDGGGGSQRKDERVRLREGEREEDGELRNNGRLHISLSIFPHLIKGNVFRESEESWA